jgi:hypothetical protein
MTDQIKGAHVTRAPGEARIDVRAFGLGDAVQVACGGDHIVILTSQGRVIGCGPWQERWEVCVCVGGWVRWCCMCTCVFACTCICPRLCMRECKIACGGVSKPTCIYTCIDVHASPLRMSTYVHDHKQKRFRLLAVVYGPCVRAACCMSMRAL